MGWLRAAHPLPVALVLLLTALIAFASADGAPDARRLVLLLLAMLFSQLAIGWTNDYVDRGADRLNRPEKPVAAGLVDARLLPPAVAATTAFALAAGAFLGLAPLLFLVAGTAAGLAYDLRLKNTRLSFLPYVVAFAVLPPYVWSALGVYRGDFAWLYLAGTPLAVGTHVANGLPDLASDAASGRGGLHVALGRRRSLRLIAACLLLPPALLLASLAAVDYDEAVLVPALGAYAVLTGAAALAYVPSSARRGEIAGFRLVALAGIVFAAGWLASVT